MKLAPFVSMNRSKDTSRAVLSQVANTRDPSHSWISLIRFVYLGGRWRCSRSLLPCQPRYSSQHDRRWRRGTIRPCYGRESGKVCWQRRPVCMVPKSSPIPVLMDHQYLQRVGFQFTLDLCACKASFEPKYQDLNQRTSNYQRLLPAVRFAGPCRQ